MRRNVRVCWGTWEVPQAGSGGWGFCGGVSPHDAGTFSSRAQQGCAGVTRGGLSRAEGL